jgi:CRP-like cAMP-binding protein
MATIDLLAAAELFIGLPDEALARARAMARVEHLPQDTLIFGQGASAERAYAVAEGSVRITQSGSDGAQAVIRFIPAGGMFGTVPLFTDHLCPANAIAAEASTILSWSEPELFTLIDAHPRISMNVIRVIGARLADLQDRVRELATQRAEQRLARALLRLTSRTGSSMEGGVVAFPLRRKDLAEFAGTTLHTASRTLAAWEKAGVLSGHRARIVIHDVPALRRLTNSD